MLKFGTLELVTVDILKCARIHKNSNIAKVTEVAVDFKNSVVPG